MLRNTSPAEFILSLADGTYLTLRAVDAESVRITSFLAKAARLKEAPSKSGPDTHHAVLVTKSGQTGMEPQGSVAGANGPSVCVLGPRSMLLPLQWQPEEADPDLGGGDGPAPILHPLSEDQWFWQQLVRLSSCIGRETQARGGVLLHSGLAVYPDSRPLSQPGKRAAECGILLAGRSGVGKSTAIRRLPSPWRTLADDVTLLVQDARGAYWAHPWPTWSRFFGEGANDGSDTWDVQQAVPLRAIFVLEQGEEDRVKPVGAGQAVCLLAELGLQTSTYALEGMPLDEVAAFNLQRFDNLCNLVQTVPVYLLDVSLDGAFWQEIERVTQPEGM